MVTVRTARLTLRMPQESDAAPLLAIHEDPEVVSRVTAAGPFGGLTSAWRQVAMMVGHWQMRGYGQWVVVENATGEVVGRVGFYNPAEWPGIELGWIMRRSRWGRGFATEAARASLEWAWRESPIDHIISLITPDNLPSIRIAEKIGERLEREDVHDGKPTLVYGIRRT